MAEEKDTNFKITDRRKFNPDGTPRESDVMPDAHSAEPQSAEAQGAEPQGAEAAAAEAIEQGTAEPSKADPSKVVSFPTEAERKREQAQPSAPNAADERRATGSRPVSAAEQAYAQTTGAQPRGLPEANFLSLINMLAVEAAMHLGLIETPGEPSPGVDLEAARHMIDMLGVLEQKTRGNLGSDEERLLENILADLRMQYVALSRRR